MKKGEVWKISHVRKGELTVRLENDISPETVWANVELLEGKPQYINNETRIGLTERPGKGDVLSIRVSLVRFLEKILDNPA